MRLTSYTDYSFRVLIHTALRGGERVTIDEVASCFGVSREHLVKVVHDLGRAGFLVTRRGVGGGFTLGRPAERIRLGDIARFGEGSGPVIECSDRRDLPCRLLPACRLKRVFGEAAAAFFAVLDRYSLADLLRHPNRMREVLGI